MAVLSRYLIAENGVVWSVNNFRLHTMKIIWKVINVDDRSELKGTEVALD